MKDIYCVVTAAASIRSATSPALVGRTGQELGRKKSTGKKRHEREGIEEDVIEMQVFQEERKAVG